MFIVTELACGGDLLALLLSDREVNYHHITTQEQRFGGLNSQDLYLRVAGWCFFPGKYVRAYVDLHTCVLTGFCLFSGY